MHKEIARRLGDVEAVLEEPLRRLHHVFVFEDFVGAFHIELLHILLQAVFGKVFEHLHKEIFAVGVDLRFGGKEGAHAHRRGRLAVGGGDLDKALHLAADADARLDAQLFVERLAQKMPEFEGRFVGVHELNDDKMGIVHAHRHIGSILQTALDVGKRLLDALGNEQFDGKTSAVG